MGKIYLYRICSNKRTSAFIFRLTFWKKLFIKNAINSHFSFFWPYKGLGECVHWGDAFIRTNTVIRHRKKVIRKEKL
jgi:hypothetical protein